jgi:hypothetical protein
LLYRINDNTLSDFGHFGIGAMGKGQQMVEWFLRN